MVSKLDSLNDLRAQNEVLSDRVLVLEHGLRGLQGLVTRLVERSLDGKQARLDSDL